MSFSLLSGPDSVNSISVCGSCGSGKTAEVLWLVSSLPFLRGG